MDSPAGEGLGRLLEVLALCASRGSLYALISVGFALALGSGGVLNLFHGSFFLIGAYGAYLAAAANLAGESPVTRFLATLLVGAAVGALALCYHRAILRPAAGSWLRLVTVGMAANLLVSEGFRAYFGTRSASVPPIVDGTTRVGALNVPTQELFIVLVAATILSALGWVLTRTSWGLSIRAVAQDPVGARLVGINPTLTLAITVALSGLLAGLAGALAAPTRIVRPDMWSFALLKALTVVIVGGIGSLRGTTLAAFGLGALEVTTTAFVGETAAELSGVLVAVAVLSLRPRGVVSDA